MHVGRQFEHVDILQWNGKNLSHMLLHCFPFVALKFFDFFSCTFICGKTENIIACLSCFFCCCTEHIAPCVWFVSCFRKWQLFSQLWQTTFLSFSAKLAKSDERIPPTLMMHENNTFETRRNYCTVFLRCTHVCSPHLLAWNLCFCYVHCACSNKKIYQKQQKMGGDLKLFFR